MNEKAITYYVLRDLSRSTKTSGMIKCRILGSVSAVEFYIYIYTHMQSREFSVLDTTFAHLCNNRRR